VYEPAMIVASISQFDEFGVRTRRLGACHSGYCVTHENYETAGPVLLDGLDDTPAPPRPMRCATHGACP
jgi:hypothetical protein